MALFRCQTSMQGLVRQVGSESHLPHNLQGKLEEPTSQGNPRLFLCKAFMVPLWCA